MTRSSKHINIKQILSIILSIVILNGSTSFAEKSEVRLVEAVADDTHLVVSIFQKPEEIEANNISEDADVFLDFETREPIYDYKISRAESSSDVDEVNISVSSYDPRGSRSEPDINSSVLTPIKNQGSDGSCWIFAIYATLEHYIKKTYGQTLDFSEEHVKFAYAKNSVGNEFGAVALAGDGGNAMYMPAYFFRPYLGGPVLEEYDPYILYNESGITRTIEQISSYPISSRVTGIQLIPTPRGETVVSPAEDILFQEQIKRAILTYGSTTCSYENNSTRYRVTENLNYPITYYSTSDNSNHNVCIVGWDDNVPASLFTSSSSTKESPAGNGAWLVKNSWGNSAKTESGYFWMSYYTHIKRPYTVNGYDMDFDGAVYTNAGTCYANSNVSSTNELYYGDSYTCNAKGAVLEEVSFFLFQNDAGNSYLNSIKSVGYGQDIMADAEIYTAVGNLDSDTQDLYKQAVLEGVKSARMSYDYCGMQTIRLDTPVDVENKKFVVLVKLTSKVGQTLYVPWELSSGTKTGEGYYSKDGNDWKEAPRDIFISAVLNSNSPIEDKYDGVLYQSRRENNNNKPIEKTDISYAAVEFDNKETVEPIPIVKLNGDFLVYGEDFFVTYYVSNGAVLITGKGKYEGTVGVSFSQSLQT